MKSSQHIQFCMLHNYETVTEAIFSLTSISRSQLKKYKFSKNFLSKRVIQNDELSLPINLVNYLVINPTYNASEMSGQPVVIFENEKVLGISKPVKVHCHPLSYAENDNLLSYLVETKYFSLLAINSKSYDRSLLYRLDYETSGVVLFAKTESVYADIRKNYSMKLKAKKYFAIVVGKSILSGNYTHHLVDKGRKNSFVEVASEYTNESKKAEIRVETLDYNKQHDLSLLTIHLQQGHRHQIRVQLSALDHPILGDLLYGGGKNLVQKDASERMFLHCFEYQIDLNPVISVRDENLGLFSNFFNFDGKL